MLLKAPMSFLDRFKPQARWKHADPAIRAAAVGDIPEDDEHRAVIAELATKDEDVRVRRAAVARLADVGALVTCARGEPDEPLRREIAERLVGVATTASDTDGDAALALDALTIRSAGINREDVSTRHGPHGGARTCARCTAAERLPGRRPIRRIALEAVARVAEATELINIAVKTDHKERRHRGARAGHGHVGGGQRRSAGDARRRRHARKKQERRAAGARVMVQASTTPKQPAKRPLEEWQQRVGALVARVEALAVAPSRRMPASSCGRRSRVAGETGAGTFEMDQETVARFGSLAERARTVSSNTNRPWPKQRAAEEERAAVRAARAALCERVEAARGDERTG